MKTRKEFWIILGVNIFLLIGCLYGIPPFKNIMNYGSKLKATQGEIFDAKNNGILENFNTKVDFATKEITIEFKKGEHFWHPQISIWAEDFSGNYIKSLFVTNSTAKNKFFAGRTAENFKTFDNKKHNPHNETRKVDALPYWSHRRGTKLVDGNYSPPKDDNIDGISGATPSGNFMVSSEIKNIPNEFVLLLEINVAFDDNEFYSEYDFPDDKEYHGGTGLLGQPSLIYAVKIDINNGKKYYFMELIGHSHHSGKTGKLYNDLSKITTAKGIVDRIIVEIK